MKAIVRRTSDPASTEPTEIEFADLDSLVTYIYESEHACILVVEDDGSGERILQVEVYDEA